MDISDERKIGTLCALVADLGEGGGVMSPSVYDTAQVLRYCPPAEGVESILHWLASSQLPDGGWGNKVRSCVRDIPTIAALLAFATYPEFSKSKTVIDAGLKFLEQHHDEWAEIVPEDLPVGVELILPKLLSDAKQFDLLIPSKNYQNLFPIYERKISFIRSMPFDKSAAPSYSWEAWGESADKKWLDEITGSLGHSPTATAYWVHLAKEYPNLQGERERAIAYLASASKMTGGGFIPGLYPTAWPLRRFEQAFSLHALLIADLLNMDGLKVVVKKQLDDLKKGVQPTGIGFSDHFITDGDDTAAAAAVFCALDEPLDRKVLDYYAYKDHYRSYIGELQASHSVTARAIFALRAYGVDLVDAEKYLLSHQLSTGAWPGDKWNISEYYGTCLATFALKDRVDLYRVELTNAATFLVDSQLAAGGWGLSGMSNSTDTACALLALYPLINAGLVKPEIFLSGQKWLKSRYEDQGFEIERRWLNKQEFSPYRIDQVFQLAAMLAVPEKVLMGVV
ncbi:MAG: hypothetical protein ACI9EW_000980 [Cellvibrionaceae bacterium]|jgi:hypothetical protein